MSFDEVGPAPERTSDFVERQAERFEQSIGELTVKQIISIRRLALDHVLGDIRKLWKLKHLAKGQSVHARIEYQETLTLAESVIRVERNRLY